MTDSHETPMTTPMTDLETTASVFAGLHRSAEADVTRVIALYEQWVTVGPPPLGTGIARWWDRRLVELHDAIAPPATEDSPAETDEERTDGKGEPTELSDLPREVRHLVHAVDRMQSDWAESSGDRRKALWRDLHEASDAVWNRPAADHPAGLRDRIAAAIWERQNPGRRWADCEYRWRADAEADADAVLAVLGRLPAPGDDEVPPQCTAGLLPATSERVDRCIRRGPHDSHRTAAGAIWGDGSNAEAAS